MRLSFFIRQILSGATLGRTLCNAEIQRAGRSLQGRVLDVAGGAGSYLRLLPPELEVVRTDLEERPGVVSVDFNKPLPFGDASFDHVLFMNALYIVEDPERLLREIRRVTKKGGSVLIASPYLQSEMRGPHDFRRLTSEGLEVLFARTEFTAVDLRPYGERFSAGAQLLHPFFYFSIVRLPIYALALALDARIPYKIRTLHPSPIGYFCLLRV